MLKIPPSPLTPVAESPHGQFLSHVTQSSRLNPLRNGKCLRGIISQAVILGGWGVDIRINWLVGVSFTKNTCSGNFARGGREGLPCQGIIYIVNWNHSANVLSISGVKLVSTIVTPFLAIS